MLLGNQHLWENFVIGESSAKISRFFSGLPLNFQDIPRITLGGGLFYSSARNFVPLQVLEYLFGLEKERIQDGLGAKFSATSKCVFCRIRNESFQGNLGIWLVFFTVHVTPLRGGFVIGFNKFEEKIMNKRKKREE